MGMVQNIYAGAARRTSGALNMKLTPYAQRPSIVGIGFDWPSDDETLMRNQGTRTSNGDSRRSIKGSQRFGVPFGSWKRPFQDRRCLDAGIFSSNYQVLAGVISDEHWKEVLEKGFPRVWDACPGFQTVHTIGSDGLNQSCLYLPQSGRAVSLLIRLSFLRARVFLSTEPLLHWAETSILDLHGLNMSISLALGTFLSCRSAIELYADLEVCSIPMLEEFNRLSICAAIHCFCGLYVDNESIALVFSLTNEFLQEILMGALTLRHRKELGARPITTVQSSHQISILYNHSTLPFTIPRILVVIPNKIYALMLYIPWWPQCESTIKSSHTPLFWQNSRHCSRKSRSSQTCSTKFRPPNNSSLPDLDDPWRISVPGLRPGCTWSPDETNDHACKCRGRTVIYYWKKLSLSSWSRYTCLIMKNKTSSLVGLFSETVRGRCLSPAHRGNVWGNVWRNWETSHS